MFAHSRAFAPLLVSAFTFPSQCDLMVWEEKDVVEARLKALQDNHWVSKQTRVVVIEFAVYNANLNRFCAVRLSFNFPATGGVLVFERFSSLLLLPQLEPIYRLATYLIFSLCTAAFVLLHLFEEFGEMHYYGFTAYFKDVWNW